MKYRFLYTIFVFLVSCSGKIEKLPFYNSAEFTPEWIETDAPGFQKIHQIASFSFLNQNGELITEKKFKDKIYVSDFIFTTCPGICPNLTANMVEIQKAFKNEKDVMLVSYSVNPKIDTVAQLKKYADLNGVLDTKWHLLTGKKSDLYYLARTSYFADKELGQIKNTNDFIHTENFILVDKKRRIRGIYNGTLPVEVKRIIEDIKTLMLEDQSKGFYSQTFILFMNFIREYLNSYFPEQLKYCLVWHCRLGY